MILSLYLALVIIPYLPGLSTAFLILHVAVNDALHSQWPPCCFTRNHVLTASVINSVITGSAALEMMAAVSRAAELVQRRLPDVRRAMDTYQRQQQQLNGGGATSVAERLTERRSASAHVS